MAAGGSRVVCISDKPETVERVRQIMGRSDVLVHSAASAKAGLQLVGIVHPDLVLLDLMMPDMDGWEVYQKLKLDDELAEIPVVVVSASATAIDQVLGLAIEKIDDYLSEPFDPDVAAWHDPLTECWNRKFLDQVLADLVARAERLPMPLTISLVDVDGLARLNHVVGHLAGDSVLQELARVLKFAFPNRSMVSRIGGDEFAVVTFREQLSRVVERADAARRLARRIPLRLLQARSVSVSVTIGISSYPKDGRTPDSLLIAADRAMMNGKRQGGDQVVAV